MKNMKFIKRAFLVTLAMLLLVVSLASCGGGGEGALDTARQADEERADYFARLLNTEHSLSKKVKEKFVAAFRGYNVDSPSFDDSKVELASAMSVNPFAAKLILSAIATDKPVEIATLTNGQIVEIYFYCLQDDTAWNEKKNDSDTCAIAESVRGASEELRNSFLETVKFAPANDIDPSADSAVPTFQLAEGFVLATNVEAAKAALKTEGMRPTAIASDAEKFDVWVDSLDEAGVREIIGKLRVEANLATDGFPGIILVWVGKFLGILTKYLSFNNYVVGLFWFAIIVELLMLFFSIKQQKNSIKQAKLSPKERAIRNKYKGRNDQPSMQKMQEEIQKLYQDEGFNPMSGCLPMLIQMPVLIFLYQVVIDPLHYVMGMGAQVSGYLGTFAQTLRAAGGLGLGAGAANKGTIELLSSIGNNGGFGPIRSFGYYSNAVALHDALASVGSEPFNFNFLGLETGSVPTFTSWLIIVPILTFVAYFCSMKVTRKLSYQPAAQDPQMGMSNKIMDLTMPLMSVWIAFMTPAAIGIYWIFKCLLGMLKQFILYKAMPLPKFTEEDYKQAEKEMKNRAKNKKESTVATVAGADGRVYRSLHHIDDEDDLPPKGSVAPAKEDEEEVVTEKVKAETETKAAPAEDRPRLKEDRKNDQKK